jgi:hypothetical protein
MLAGAWRGKLRVQGLGFKNEELGFRISGVGVRI